MGLAAAGLPAGRALAAPDRRPNILFIMSDDHAAHAIGAYQGRLATLDPTPVIDSLARDGMLMENAFCTNSICTPSRASIMTGQYSHTNGVLDLGGNLPPDRQTLAIEMRKAGYHTAMVGKWHLKREPNFDYYKVLPGQGKYFDPEFREKGKGRWPKNTVAMDGHSSDCITDSTLAWLKRRDRAKPFFLMHHFKAPHDFFKNARRYDDYLADTDIPEPESLWRQPNFGSIATRGHNDELLPYIGTSIGRRHAFRNYTRKWARDRSLSDEQAKRQAYQTYLKKFLRCVKGVDDNIQRLLDALRAEGELDNTVIVYTGDQGFMLGEHDYQDKRWMYDESHRMPFIVRYPKTIPAGSRTDALVENVDYAATLLDFAGVPTPASMQGRSFRAILETGTEPDDWKQAVYYRYWMHMAHHWNPAHFGIRTKDHKLIFYYGCNYKGQNRTPPGWELYDLEEDPKEVSNVYDDPAYRDVAARLKAQLAALRERIGDTDERFPEIKAIVEEFWDYDDAARQKAIEISHQYAERAERRKRGRRRSTPNLGKPSAWIEAQPSKVPLKEHEGLKEVSRDAPYRISHVGHAGYNLDNAFLTSGQDGTKKPHAFHTAEGAEEPHVVIRLDAPRRVRYVYIRNRTNGFHDRAEGLTLWLSTDGEAWEKAWQAKAVAEEWTVDLGKLVACRYLKLGLPRRGTLHLKRIVAFGK
jgi:N-acetylglucosamine-6-sulfatase